MMIRLFSCTVVAVLLFVSTPADALSISLNGSKSAMKRQNDVADQEGLSRIPDYAALERMKRGGYLVELSNNQDVVVDNRLNSDYRWCRPWARDFLNELGHDFRKKFRRALPIRVNSAVRTAEYQRMLRGGNGNAAGISGPHASSHLTGATVDIAKLQRTSDEIRWLREWLLAKEKAGLIEATEEHMQAVFHVMVFKTKHQ